MHPELFSDSQNPDQLQVQTRFLISLSHKMNEASQGLKTGLLPGLYLLQKACYPLQKSPYQPLARPFLRIKQSVRVDRIQRIVPISE